ncbi:MAG TPA: flagellar hook assembly protein FlgD [Pararhizobium sp.]|uniref:flagellar hook assembly protein FlgD n=1 Tax=Pararhizobium sp. TaxID=1977563 RepID=UPI002CDB7104|nr:flagellar hook assembly protein FlgD [Pararhizobium sp.]HTO32841.1 flagellar hook assembly protein FlgD [Pararhizobium sp.]
MAVSGVSANKTASNTTGTGSDASNASASASLNYDSFLKLLVAQMKNQDPTEPMDSTQQIAQLATFSQVEQTIKTNTNLESLLQRTSLSEANAVIGKTVTSADGKTTGVVKEVKLYSDGIIAVLDNKEEMVIGPGVTIK